MQHRHLISSRLTRNATAALVVAGLLAAAQGSSRTATPRFYSDDPIKREPASADASGAAEWDIDLFYDLAYQLFNTAGQKPTNTPAGNLNTVDEVPDSSWFTNRIGSRPITAEELQRGPVAGPAPAPQKWTLTREKSAGMAPGFTAKDANGETWFVSFDAKANPRGATAAVVISTKIFWALGYNQVEYFVTSFAPGSATIDPKATKKRPAGKRTPMTEDDVRELLEKVPREPDGTVRAAAGRLLPGRVIGGFRYKGTRPDDPNDIVPHEHRRELRALRVFGAWTNLTDMKAGNTLDTVVTEGGRSIVRHYLQDVGSTFGVGAAGPHDANEGWEHIYEGGPTRKRLFTFGFGLSPWQTAEYPDYPSIGLFEGDSFDPETWKPRAPTQAFVEMRDDDAFWAARRVMAFSDDLIRAVVKTGELGDDAQEKYLADTLIVRRDKIGRAYLPKINPIVDPVLSATGELTFGNAAVQYGFAPAPATYTAVWGRFDNATGTSTRIGQTSGSQLRMQAPAGLPTTAGSFIEVELSATDPGHPAWTRPIKVHFRRDGAAWTLVGLQRLPPKEPGPATH
ncbi:hypothetical protein LuPra_02204 [Luteitalea pratensis]|uniref:Uncharacterized protein n=1 Tax=Luteitalea pratensis TaxID=1855912 RepID=A0A143PKQ9_LUTPR|nr:hypothetical protein [Luteitalea pratensis]AMY08996.1 hypothetical protein LuPra_02204 [Luteitalea pratensis]